MWILSWDTVTVTPIGQPWKTTKKRKQICQTEIITWKNLSTTLPESCLFTSVLLPDLGKIWNIKKRNVSMFEYRNIITIVSFIKMCISFSA
jgi:hypothetical protein